jgi:hypothetical protein
MGDNTHHALIEHDAQASAAELIEGILNTPSADFVYQQQEKVTQKNIRVRASLIR